jgi:hypothetical protein
VPTSTTTTTQVPGSFALVVPSTVRVGVAFPVSVSGAIGGGRIDFAIGGGAAGSVQPDSSGRATLNLTAWSTGTLKVEVLWTRFVAGVPIEKALSASVVAS